VLNRLVALAGKVIHAAELERERLRLEHTLTLLRAEQAQLEAGVQQLKNQQDTLQPHVAQSAHVVG
jgi:hypothetical protein